jgi:hypothetical protein
MSYSIKSLMQPTLLCLCISILSACSSPQSAVCEAYIACDSFAAETLQRDKAQTFSYGPNGVCWENDDFATMCNSICENSVSALKDELQKLGKSSPDCNFENQE